MNEKLLNEIWKPIDGYSNYEISNYGRVKSKDRFVNTRYGAKRKIKGRILKPTINGSGYYIVSLYKGNGKPSNKTIHKLVATAYLKNKHNYPVINHINGKKDDNRAENLEWCTQSHNVKESYRLGLEKPQLTGLGKLGELNKKAHLIEQINPNTNEIINRYYGVCEAFRKTNINYKNIHAVLKNKRKTAGGYIWRYVNE